jgi:pimeloyl-ACP methyl ester carboxylesterase
MGLPARAASVFIVLLFGTILGCQTTDKADPNRSPNIVLVVHGIDGAGPWYSGLVGGFKQSVPGDEVEMVQWGGPLWLLVNLKLPIVHDAAEDDLARRIDAWRSVHPDGRITLVGHSAGCGVILESLASAGPATQVDNVLLLAPAVSQNYDLRRALSHLRGTMHVFYSEHDTMLLSTLLTGTYDSVWSNSAGLHGFLAVSSLPVPLRSRLVQHAYDPAWSSLGCGGGHFGWRSKPFVQQILVPLATAAPLIPAAELAQRPAAIPANRAATAYVGVALPTAAATRPVGARATPVVASP